MTSSTASPPRALEWEWCGRVPYSEALQRQDTLVRARREGAIADRLLLLEHTHVITLGSSANRAHVLVSDDERTLLGIDLFETGRGGDVTYHGPGQLVGYPILALEEERRDLHRYVRDLEEVLIHCLETYGVNATRRAGKTGVWVDHDKIAAIGVRVSRGWITSHGFALNVATNLDFFNAIVPCGIRDEGVTSLARCTGRSHSLEHVATQVRESFAVHFQRDLHAIGTKTYRKT